jgi:hypothetical protein
MKREAGKSGHICSPTVHWQRLVNVKVKVALEQITKDKRRSSGIALLFP